MNLIDKIKESGEYKILDEFSGSRSAMANEIVRLRAELEAAQEVVRPFAKAHERWNQIGQTVPEFAVFDYAPRPISVWQAAAEWLARQGAT